MQDQLRPATTVYGATAGAVSETLTGLPCRANPTCRQVFHVRHDELCDGAAAQRNAHEANDHGYVHLALPLISNAFGAVHRRPRKTQ